MCTIIAIRHGLAVRLANDAIDYAGSIYVNGLSNTGHATE